MRYLYDHKAHTHQRIIKEASARFRRDGIGATGLQLLMKALNPTHEGFYAHFKSKDELVEKALRAAASELNAHCEQFYSARSARWKRIDSYLSQWHQTSPEDRCPLPTVSSKMGQRGQHSATTDELLETRLKQVEAALKSPKAEEQSLVIMSTLVGASVLARSLESAELAECVLEVVRESLKTQIADNKKTDQ